MSREVCCSFSRLMSQGQQTRSAGTPPSAGKEAEWRRRRHSDCGTRPPVARLHGRHASPPRPHAPRSSVPRLVDNGTCPGAFRRRRRSAHHRRSSFGACSGACVPAAWGDVDSRVDLAGRLFLHDHRSRRDLRVLRRPPLRVDGSGGARSNGDRLGFVAQRVDPADLRIDACLQKESGLEPCLNTATLTQPSGSLRRSLSRCSQSAGSPPS